MEPMTTPRAVFVLSTYLLSWAFCLYVGGQMGVGWGIAALVLFEARHLNAWRAGRRYLLKEQAKGGSR